MSNIEAALDSGEINHSGKFSKLKGDIYGGIAGAVSSLPQSIAYGVIAFAPLGPEFTVSGALAGLYSSIIGGLVSNLFGSSAIMVSGSRGATAVIFATLLTQNLGDHQKTPEICLALAFLSVLLSGFFQIFLGMIKVGHLVKYVPQTVIAGFLNGSALLILAGQILPLTNINLSHHDWFSEFHWVNVTWGALTLGLFTALMMVLTPKLWKGAPAGLVALISGTILFHILQNLTDYHLNMGGMFPTVDMALPTLKPAEALVNLFSGGYIFENLLLVLPAALSIAVISSLDSLLSAATLDNMTLQRTNGNQELIGQGMSNVCAAIFGGTPSSGGLGRSGALFQAGGRSRRAVQINVAVLVLILTCLSSMIDLLPKAVVAGVLLGIGVQLFDDWTVRVLSSDIRDHQWKDFRADLLVISCVVAATLIWNMIIAVGLGLLLAVIIFVQRMSRSVIRRYYKGDCIHSRQLRDDAIASLLERNGQRIVILELEGAIFFGSADGLEMEIESFANAGADFFILDLKRVKDIDSSGIFILQRIYQRLQKANKHLVLSYVDKERRLENRQFTAQQIERRRIKQERRMWRILRNFGVVDSFGESAFFPDTDTALGYCETMLLNKLSENTETHNVFNMLENGVFGALTKDEMDYVAQLLQQQHFSAGTVIFCQGDVGDAMYLLAKGAADVVIDIPGGRQKRVQTLFPGVLFGEMALMDGEARAASIVAIEDMDCLVLHCNDFNQLKSGHPQIALKIFSRLGVLFARRLRSANLMIKELES
jgi:MFS superfamily sulfate permease-like transporter